MFLDVTTLFRQMILDVTTLLRRMIFDVTTPFQQVIFSCHDPSSPNDFPVRLCFVLFFGVFWVFFLSLFLFISSTEYFLFIFLCDDDPFIFH